MQKITKTYIVLMLPNRLQLVTSMVGTYLKFDHPRNVLEVPSNKIEWHIPKLQASLSEKRSGSTREKTEVQAEYQDKSAAFDKALQNSTQLSQELIDSMVASNDIY